MLFTVFAFRNLLMRDKRFTKGFKYRYKRRALVYIVISAIVLVIALYTNELSNV
jgi:multisubunit Na+/H+ antiporter MnhB subunit